jgi:hypothetical protein
MAISSKVLKTISENTKDGKTWGTWEIQNFDPETKKSISVKVVFGEKKVKEGGDIWYVAKGLSVRDFESFRVHYPEFKKLSDNPPAIDAGSDDESIEEVPF